MNYKYQIIGGIILLVGGLAIGRYATPAKIEVKTEIKTVEVEKVVTKTVEKKVYVKAKQSNTQQQQQLHIIEKTLPDGTYTKESFILNKSTIVIKEKDQQTNEMVKLTESMKQKIYEEMKSKIKINNIDNWIFGAVAGVNYKDLSLENVKNKIYYGGLIERKIIGPFYLGGMMTTSHQIGVVFGAKL